MSELTVVNVDVIEPGRAFVHTPNGGQAWVGREDDKLYVEMYDLEDVELAKGQSKFDVASYEEAAQWVAAELGYDGPLDIQIVKEYEE